VWSNGFVTYRRSTLPRQFPTLQGGVPTYQEGQEPLVYLVSSLATVDAFDLPWIGSDGNIAASMSEHTNEWCRLEEIVDWALMRERVWKNSEDDGDRMRRRMAELLVKELFPDQCIEYLVAKSQDVADLARARIRDTISVYVRPNWYY
jgi:hypothetical protein